MIGFDLTAKHRRAMEGMATIWLRWIVPSYMHEIEALYAWLLAEARSIYSEEIAETNQLIEEHNGLIREAGLGRRSPRRRRRFALTTSASAR